MSRSEPDDQSQRRPDGLDIRIPIGAMASDSSVACLPKGPPGVPTSFSGGDDTSSRTKGILALLEASGRFPRVEGHYESSYRILSIVGMSVKIR
jgi:hypothetical protein